MSNHLKDQNSPYLLQHADNPVDWYPWCEDAFDRAEREDKPVFLSIGYSTCHWCHVMAHESFEDAEIAELLNRYFISVKVDKEERPDIDSVYMAVCQAFTGSGGWPTTIFLTPDQKPFFAGTYYPKTSRYGQVGLKELLLAVHERWKSNREKLLASAEGILLFLERPAPETVTEIPGKTAVEISNETSENAGIPVSGELEAELLTRAARIYRKTFDEHFGGFGDAPKFPMPHNLLFLLRYYEKHGEKDILFMAEQTLMQMYRGGIFDHVGGGFSRYSTDRYFLAPHFEKMLYDNALLILAYCKAYQVTKKSIYREVAERTAAYILREMTSPDGGFYSAQDADSEGVEGKYYLFAAEEIIGVLGREAGENFNRWFDITKHGNFEGKSIPNLLKHKEVSRMRGSLAKEASVRAERDVFSCLPEVYEYRKNRYMLHLDDKILTSWNALMIAAMCRLYRVTEKETYLCAAVKAQKFIQDKLCEDDTLYISFREGRRGGKGFLDDYAFEIFALMELYQATFEPCYLWKARKFCEKAVSGCYDNAQGGFFLYGKDHERLVLRPKETYDGAVFSGNSAMAYNLVRLSLFAGETQFEKLAKQQIAFMSGEAGSYPAGYAMFLLALLEYLEPPEKITIVPKESRGSEWERIAKLPCRIPPDTVVHVLDGPTKEYPLKNGRTTFYVCKGHTCLPPVNELPYEKGQQA